MEGIRWEENAWHIDKSLKGVVDATKDLDTRELRIYLRYMGILHIIITIQRKNIKIF